MPNLGLEIKRRCGICGKVFIIKTLDSLYCCKKCSDVAYAQVAHQTICRGEIRMKTFSSGPAVLCDMPMPNIILVIGSNGRWANSPRE